VYEVKTAGTRDAEILRLRPADACILGVDAKAKAVDEFIETITRTSIFAGLSREDLARVAGKLDEVRVAAGTTIIRQAEPGDALYVVQAGAVEILHRDTAGAVERLAILGPRECFGEIAIFTGTPRSASVVALVDTSLLRMSKAACEQLVAQCPPFSLHICRLLSERLVERGRELASSRIGRDAVLDDLFDAEAPPTLLRHRRAGIQPRARPAPHGRQARGVAGRGQRLLVAGARPHPMTLASSVLQSAMHDMDCASCLRRDCPECISPGLSPLKQRSRP